MAAHDHVFFGRFENGPLESPFSGNLVEICPTGVFTDKTFKAHSTRKWDLQTAPAVCVHCALGCNIIAGERYGTLRRVRNRYHHQINGYFLCDRGRFGYEFVNGPGRLREALQRSSDRGRAEVVPTVAVLEQAGAMLADPGRVIGIGSPRSSLENNYALRALVGPERFHAGFSRSDLACLDAITRILQQGPVPAVPLQELGMADAVLVLGEDPTQSAPLAALNLRRMRYRESAMIAAGLHVPPWNDGGVRELAQLRRPSLYLATPYPTALDDEALRVYHGAPDRLIRLGYGIMAALDPDAAVMPDLDDDARALAAEIAHGLSNAQRPLVVAGTGCAEPALIEVAANLAWRLKRLGRTAALFFGMPECNSLGLGLMGGRDLASAFAAIQQGQADTVVILENDLFRRAEAAAVNAMLERARHVIVIDHQDTATAAKAHLVLPSATFAECTGTLVNNEGRAQRGYAVMPCREPVRAAWRWLGDLIRAPSAQSRPPWRRLDEVAADMIDALPVFRAAAELTAGGPGVADNKIPRQFHRYSGRTAMQAHIAVSELAPPVDEDSPLAFSMEGDDGRPPPELMSRIWAPGWNSVQALNKFQSEIGGPLRGGDAGRRLIEPASDDHGRYFTPPIPANNESGAGYRLVPIHHIFGSEALSMAAPAIAQRAPRPYLAMNPEDAPPGESQIYRLCVCRGCPAVWPAGPSAFPACRPSTCRRRCVLWACRATGRNTAPGMRGDPMIMAHIKYPRMRQAQ
jgi:NADH-quinone oxidoreductase subunit G